MTRSMFDSRSKAKPRPATLKSITVYLLKVSIAITTLTSSYNELFVGHQERATNGHQVAAARIKGLIYNRDGKFIYRPTRWNQPHIIVIDERTPKTTSSKDTNSKQQDEQQSASNRTETTRIDPVPVASTFSQGPVMHLFAPAALPYHSLQQAAAVQHQLQHQMLQHQHSQQQPVAVGHLAAADSIKASYAPSPPFQLINLNDLQAGGGAVGRQAAVASSGAVVQPPMQMMPIIQLVPHSPLARASVGHPFPSSGQLLLQHQMAQQQQQQQQQAASSQPPVDTYGSYLQSTNFDFAGHEIEPDQIQQQQARSSASGYGDELAQSPYYQSVREQRGSSYDDQSSAQFGGGANANQMAESFYDHKQFQSVASRSEPPPDMVPFDEPPPSHHSSMMMRNAKGNSYPFGGHQSKSRRVVPAPVQDLNDVEGGHVEYYETGGGRERSRVDSMASYERGSHRQYVKPPPLHHSAGETRSPANGLSPGPPPLMQQNQTPIPGSIQSVKSHLKRATSSSTGSGAGLGSSLKSPKAPISRSASKDDVVDQTASVSASLSGKEPKSSQYWKQYQDQFDMV